MGRGLSLTAKKDGEFTRVLLASTLGTVVGGIISIVGVYLTANLAAADARQRFIFERAPLFADLLASRGLPLPGQVAAGCEETLKECLRQRRSAIEMYLFLPDAQVHDVALVIGGPEAERDIGAGSDNYFSRALKGIKKYTAGEVSSGFPFVLPCAAWPAAEARCKKP
jgi:hypothetical protein